MLYFSKIRHNKFIKDLDILYLMQAKPEKIFFCGDLKNVLFLKIDC